MSSQNNKLALQFEALLSTPSIVEYGNGFKLFKPEFNPEFRSDNFPSITDKLVFGKRMERLFSHYISQSDRYSLLAENLQLIKDKVTIGELDFLIKDNELEQTIHLEIACKFYIYRPGLSPDKMACWIGPNKKDKLVDKLLKLRDRQFPLLQHTVTQQALKALNISHNTIQQQLFLPGILFLPKGYNDDSGNVNPKAINGYWLTIEQFKKEDFQNCQLAIPEKENWMVDPKHNSEWLPVEKARDLIADKLKNQRSPMVWRKTKFGDYERFFVLWW